MRRIFMKILSCLIMSTCLIGNIYAAEQNPVQQVVSNIQSNDVVYSDAEIQALNLRLSQDIRSENFRDMFVVMNTVPHKYWDDKLLRYFYRLIESCKITFSSIKFNRYSYEKEDYKAVHNDGALDNAYRRTVRMMSGKLDRLLQSAVDEIAGYDKMEHLLHDYCEFYKGKRQRSPYGGFFLRRIINLFDYMDDSDQMIRSLRYYPINIFSDPALKDIYKNIATNLSNLVVKFYMVKEIGKDTEFSRKGLDAIDYVIEFYDSHPDKVDASRSLRRVREFFARVIS